MKYSRHWSFVVCDPKYLYPLTLIFLLIGIYLAISLKDYTQLNRVGNFIVAIGVWMSMRSTFREGINKDKNYADQFPVHPITNQLNSIYFNNLTFSIGDAQLQIKGFFLVLAGSIIGSYGDIILRGFFKLIN